MDYLLAKVLNNMRIVLADATVFTDVNVTAELPYNDERKLQDGEWFCIQRFSEQSYFPNFPFDRFVSTDYHNISANEYEKIKYFLSIQEDSRIFHFQRVLTRSRIIQKKGIKLVNEHPVLIEMENVLTINSEPDATYYLDNDKLLFRDLSRVRPMFSGIEVLFREATDEEVDNFLNIDIINLANGFDRSKVSMPNRRRISNAITQYNAFHEDEKQTLCNYMSEYCPEIIDPASSSVQIGSDDHLKKFIYAIDQRYYITPIRNQKRVATSIENI